MRKRRTITAAALMIVSSVLLQGCSFDKGGSSDAAAFQPTDGAITRSIESEFRTAQTLANGLAVKTGNGVVTLSGTVDNLLAEEQALKIARSTRGVRSVVDELLVVPEKRSDDAIQADLKTALNAEPVTQHYGLDVAVDSGIVSLNGTVDSWAERWLAGDIVRGVKGVAGIEDYIVVTGETPNDEQLKADVETELQVDAWVNDRLIDVEVHDGAVALSGAVGSAAERLRAGDDALVVGAKDVDVSGLLVEWSVLGDMERDETLAHVPDAEIQRAVADALGVDPRVQRSAGSVDVDGGIVTLVGNVTDLRSRLAMVEDAANTLGVMGVVDSLTMERNGEVADSDVATNVKQTLDRDPYLGRYDIDVTVAEGVVHLTGTVGLGYEKTHAEKVVQGLSHVAAVENELRVDTDAVGKSDQEILASIEQKLYWNAWLADADVDVSVEDGVATIKGSVHGWFERNLLHEIGKEAGARGVLTELNIAVRHTNAG